MAGGRVAPALHSPYYQRYHEATHPLPPRPPTLPVILLRAEYHTGHVRTLQGAPVEYARVLALVPTDSTILAYTFTDALGGYRLSVSSTQPQLLISVASMEIERMDRRVENVSQTCDFRVKESRTLLREVQVKARKTGGRRTRSITPSAPSSGRMM